MISLNWIKCQGSNWCKLSTVNLQHKHFSNLSGVYIIWHGGSSPRVVRVGQGIIKDRLVQHRTGPLVQQYANQELFVTWARVSNQSSDGVEGFLAENLKPLVGSNFPNVVPIEVNLPW